MNKYKKFLSKDMFIIIHHIDTVFLLNMSPPLIISGNSTAIVTEYVLPCLICLTVRVVLIVLWIFFAATSDNEDDIKYFVLSENACNQNFLLLNFADVFSEKVLDSVDDVEIKILLINPLNSHLWSADLKQEISYQETYEIDPFFLHF